MATVNHSDNLESCLKNEGNTNNQQKNQHKSGRNYDIFVKRPGNKEVSKVTFLERCHGWLRFTFLVSLLLIVLFTALISRMAFHIIMINLNPPTIFTTMNKLGGDIIVNKTLAFVPAKVHFSWMWACFLVLITPSVHSFVYHMGQLCRKKNLDIDDTDEETMTFLIQSPEIVHHETSSESPEIVHHETSSESSEMVHHKTCSKICNGCAKVFKTDPEPCEEKTYSKANGWVQWIIIIALGIGQAICETIAVFVILPTYDQTTASIIAVLMTTFTPLILNGLINPYFRFQKYFRNRQVVLRNIFRLIFLALLISIFFLLGAFVIITHTYENTASYQNAIAVAIVIFFLSMGSWENLSGFYIEKLNKRTKKMAFLSVFKFLTHCFSFITIVGVMGGLEGLTVLINGLPSAKLTMFDKSILLVNNFPFGVDCSLYHPFLIAVISIATSYACYKFSYYACRTNLQIWGFALPLMLNIFLFPFIIWQTFKPDSLFSKFENCSIISNAWDSSVVQENSNSRNLIIACGSLTFLCILLLTTYIWRHGHRIAKLEKLFAMPFYAGYAVDITLLWSRRRFTKKKPPDMTNDAKVKQDSQTNQRKEEDSQNTQNITNDPKQEQDSQTNQRKEDSQTTQNITNDAKEEQDSQTDQRKEESPQNTQNKQDIKNGQTDSSKVGNSDSDTMIPFIYLCATMWHETEQEMRTLLRSIFRLNVHQFETTYLQNSLMSENKQPDETYFQFEAHIFFDDAFKENKEKVKGVKSKQTEWKRFPGKEVNDFVKQFIKCVEDTARPYYDVTIFNQEVDKFITPYGARLEWTLESPPGRNVKRIEECLNIPCRLILHLKDRFLVRNKKRWSQVMYMYYLLSFIPTAKYKTDFEPKTREENASQNEDGLQKNSQNQDGTLTNLLNQNESQANLQSQEELQNNSQNQEGLRKNSQNQDGSKTNPQSPESKRYETKIAPKTFILALDGDVDFRPDAVLRLLERMLKNDEVGAACGRIIPMGTGPVVWYQKFEYAVSHWLQKATEHVYGCVLCSPGCFSLFRASALMSDDVIKMYTGNPSTALECIQFDQGEDRWLSTLLLKQGFKLEYTAASDAYTYVPEGFFEFFNQRRRWSPSTLANIFEIILNISSVSNANNFISKPYLFYHSFLFVSSFITPGTIFLMILGATNLAFPGIPIWLAFLINITLIGVVMLSCLLVDQERQLNIIAVISSIYALMMIVVLFGLILDAVRSEFCSVTTYFFCYVAGIFLLAAILHPREMINIIYGALYFLAVPTTSMLMLIYALGNLHVTSWGTRESNKVKKGKNLKVDESEDNCSCFGLCRCSCMPRVAVKTKLRKDKSKLKKKEKTEKKKDGQKNDVKNNKTNNSKSSKVTRLEDLRNAEEVDEEEKAFWNNIIHLYLNPSIKEDKTLKEKLKSLRNGVYAGFIMINLIYITIVFVITQSNELNNDIFTINLPCPYQTKTFGVDPISVVFSITFGVVLFSQLLGMLIHRYSTFTHVVSVSRIQWIWKGVCKKESDGKTKKPDPRHHNAVLHMFQENRGNLKKSITDRAMDHWNECETKKEEPETDSDNQSDNKGRSFSLMAQ